MKKNYLFIIILFLSSLYNYAQVCTVSITSSDTDNIICANESVTFTATPSTAGALYQWRVNGVNVGPNSSTTTFTPAMPFQSGATVTVTLTPNTASCTGPAITSNMITTVVNTVPTITGTTPNSRCGNGTVTLGATASSGTINWYAASTGGSSLGTGTSFTTPIISATTTYYVDATAAGCTTGSRTAVIATINAIPTITGTTPNSRCGNGTVTLGATASSGIINWYEALTGGSSLGTGTSFTTPNIIATKTYYVDAKDATTGCTTGSRTAVLATVNAIPTITSIAPDKRCGNGIITLGATASSGTVNWYAALTGGSTLQSGTSFTTPDISATKTYYVDATDTATGCITGSRTAVIATIDAIPTITGTTPNSGCENGKVTLGATASSGTINWYATATGGLSLGTGTSFTTPNITATTTYYVDATVTATGCTTGSRTAIVATVNAIPTIASSTPNSRCGLGTVTLGATASSGIVNWYASLTGGVSLGTGINFTTPSISASTTYYVDATATGCTTGSRTAVVATVNNIPTITGTIPGSRCLAGTVTLGANASAGIINWYATPTGGTILGTGTSFTTPSISATTTYYADATAAGCTTGSRTAVIATVDSIPTITGTISGSRCNDGIVTLSATASAGIINWYANAAGGVSLANGTNYSPNITATKTYYVDATVGACTTGTRTAVVATKYSAAPTTGNGNNTASMPSGPQSICPGPAATGYIYKIPSNMSADAETYNWNLPPGFIITSVPGTREITVSVPGPGAVLGNNNISVTAINSCGNSGASKILTVNIDSFAAVNTGADFSMCIGTNQTLTNLLSGNANSVTWAITSGSGTITGGPYPAPFIYTPISSGSATLTATTNTATGSCSASTGTDQVIITVNQPSVVPTSLSTSLTTVCSGSTTTLTQSGGSLGTGASWKWYSDATFNTLIGTGIGDSASLPVSPPTTTTYYLRAESSTGAPCTAKVAAIGSITVTVNQPSIAPTSLSALPSTICAGSNTTISQSGGALGTGASWKWYSDASFTNLVGIGTEASANLSVSPPTTTTYYLRAESAIGAPCVDNVAAVGSVTVTVSERSISPTSLSTSLTPVCGGNPITLTQSGGSLGTGASWHWYSDASFTTLIGTSTGASASLSVSPPTTTTYYLRAESSTGAPCAANVAAAGSVTVTVNQPSIAPTSISASTSTICNGNNTILTQSGGILGTAASWKWYSDASFTTLIGTTVLANASLSVSPTTTTTYYLRAESITGAPCTANIVALGSVTVTVSTPSIAPTSLSTSLTSICSGTPVTLTQIGGSLGTGAVWKWYSNNTYTNYVGIGIGANADLSVSPTSNITYYLRAEDTSAPCAMTALGSTAGVAVTVNQPVVITTQPNGSQTVCSGFPASLSVLATGTGLSYEWFKDGISTGIFTSVLNINQAKLSDAGTYTVFVKGASPCTNDTSNNAVLNVNQEIEITTQPSAKVNCEGDTTTFEVAATGSSLNYVWRKGGIPIPAGGNISGETTAILTITGAALTNAGSYDVVVSGSGTVCAQTISTAALLTLNTKSANPTSASATAAVICSGASTILNLTGGGGGTNEVIKWYSDSCGGTLVGTGNGLSVSPTTSTTYYGRYENTGICSYNSVCASVTVTVNYNSTISLSSAIGTDNQTKCINNAINPITYEIGGGGSTASITAGALPTGITGLYSGGIFTISGTPTVFGTFNYTVTTSGPCNNVSLSGVLTINPNSTIILTSAAGTDNQTKCINNVITPINYAIGAIGTSASITAGTLPTGLTGVFSAGVFTISGTPSIQGIFNYTVTTAGLCNNASLSGTITVNPDSVITLNSAAGTDTQSKCINNAITPITYTVGGGGTGASITAGALPTGVTASFATGTFTISGTPSVAGTFSYTVTTSGSCTNVSLSGTITVTPLPVVTFNYGATTFCKSAANPSLNFTGGGVAGVFTSSPGGLTINTSTGAIDLTTSAAGKYDVTNTFASTGGCITVSHTEKITIDPINIGGSVTGLMDGVAKTVITSCHEGAGILNLTGNTGNVIKWEYSVDGGVNWTADNSNKTNTYNYIGIKATTLYRAAIQSGVCDIVYSAIAFVNVIPPNIKPSPVSATPTVLCLGDTSQFTSQSSYGTGQFLQGGDFQTGQLNTQDPKGWLVDGAPGGYTASGDNTKPNHWAGTNPHPFPGGIFYNSGDPKFAIANGQLTTILETPVINSLGLTSFNFGFDQAYNLLAGDRILIELSTNGGTNYTVILQDITGPAQSALFNTFANDNTNFDLQKYIGQTQLRVRFTFKGVNTNSAWALDNFKFPDAPAAQTVEWTDEKGNIIGTTNTVGVKPTAPGIRVYGVTSLINGCRSTGIDGTVFVTVNVNYAYAGKDVAISPAECGTNTVSLNAYDNSLSAAKNILKGAYTHIAQPNEDPDFLNVSGTGASGKWTIKSSTATCGPGNFSTKNPAKYPDPAADPDAIFTGDAGTYVLTWTSGGCSDDVTAILTNCTTVDFDGDNDNVTFKDNYDITTDFSIEIWVKPNSVSGTQTIFSKRDANNLATGYDLKLSGTKISFNWNAVGTIISPFDIGTDRWYHIAVTFSSGTYKLYIDGINVQNTTGALPGSNNFDCLLGAMDQTGNPPNKPVNHFKGWMDELRIWNVALTPEQLHQMMNQEIKSNGTAVIGEVVPIDVNGLSWTTNLLGYYRMDVNNCGHLVPTAGAIDGKLRNITTILEQTAPIPYTSRADGQDWGTDNTWTHFNVWDAPNSKGVDNSTSIEWNIVETSHNINSGNKDITVLGLISKVGKLTIANPAISAPIEANIGKGLWITLYLKLNGSIDLVGESQLVQKRYLPTYFNESILDQASTGYIERDQQGQRNSYNYNYWSSPVSFQGGLNNAPYSVSGVIKDGTNSADPRTISFQDWKYSADGTFISPIIISNQWIWSYNAPVKSTDIQNYNQWNHIGSTGLLKTGEGFTMKGTGGTAATDITQNYVFVGKPNNATISLPLPLNQIYLIGNPYPSALDADEFIKNNLKDCVGCTATQNVFNGTLYFWDHFRVTDNHILEEYVGGYAAYNLSGGVLSIANSSLTVHDFSVGSKVPKRYIPVAQGFFIDAPLGTSTATPSLNFNNNQRVFERENVASSVFMKAVANTKTKLIDTRLKIRLGFDSFVGMHRQLLVTADSNTTSAYDIGYDAPIFDLKTNDMFWEIDNKKYVIQGINNFNEDQIIPLGLTISDKGPITIQIDELENITESTKIYLYDAFTASYYNIRDKAFTISLEIGEYKNRFSILFVNKTLSVEETILNEKIEILYANNYRTLIIQNKIPDTTVNDVYLINILGQTVSKWDVEDKDQTRIQIPIKNFASGVYIVKLKTSKGEMSEKIIIK